MNSPLFFFFLADDDVCGDDDEKSKRKRGREREQKISSMSPLFFFSVNVCARGGRDDVVDTEVSNGFSLPHSPTAHKT